jgi:hypothetical protein
MPPGAPNGDLALSLQLSYQQGTDRIRSWYGFVVKNNNMKSAAHSVQRAAAPQGEEDGMRFEELRPHLNKISTLYLRNNKRKVGWIYIEDASFGNIEEVYFVCVQKGRKVMTALEVRDVGALKPFREHIRVKDIVRIRSSK